MQFIKTTTFEFAFFLPFVLVCGTDGKWTDERWEKNPLINKTTDTYKIILKLRTLHRKVINSKYRRNLGFVLKGDDWIYDQDWEDQKNFTRLMVAILSTGTPRYFVATQYGSTFRVIQRLTRNKSIFLRKIRQEKRLGGFERRIHAAVFTAASPMLNSTDETNTLIVVGDGVESLIFKPRHFAKVLERRGIDVMGVGPSAINGLATILGIDPKNVFETDGYFDLAEAVYGLVVAICRLEI